MRFTRTMIIVAGGALLLGGCGGNMKEALGIQRKPPDEFQVVTRAPLAMPPTLQLRPPAPGERRPQEQAPREAAREALVGSAMPSPAASAGADRSAGEAALLDKVGVGHANADIRQVVNRESVELAEDDRTLVDRLMFWRDYPPPGTVVDAQKESQRLRENAALGQPPTAGETPIIERKATSRGITIF